MDFAVVGLDCWLPGSPDASAWLARGRAGVPALSQVPAGRWPMDPATVLDPTPGAPDAVTTLIGGFVEDDEPIDDGEGALDPIFGQVVRVVGNALGTVRRHRADLVLANLSLASTGAIRAASGPWRRWLAEHGADPKWLAGGTLHDLHHGPGPALLARQALGLGGEAFALDAACASSLYAVMLACDRLAEGRCDVAIAAGVQRADSAYLFLGFSQLRALSRSGVPRPLDRRGDGLVVGEGAAAVALKRLPDAIRDGDPIHAVIRGGGLGNDGRKGNLLAPDGDGQRRALTAAYSRSGILPSSVGYVECHATGTPLGDGTEVATLAALHVDRTTPLVLASTKGLLGHTITVAGLAGLIRAVGAVRDGWLPPMPDCEPLPDVDGTRLAVLPESKPWEEPTRRAGVSAFGFGGTNAHVLVENYVESPALPPPAALRELPRLAVVGVAARIGQARGAGAVARALLDGRYLIDVAPIEATRGLADLPPGAWVDEILIDPTRFRIPPRELPEILPQQLALLDVAADALAQVEGLDPHTTASIVGMGIDLHVAEAVIRMIPSDRRLRDAIAPPLGASRVQGTLPNFVANRVAAILDLRGPSFTVSSGERSGVTALTEAARLLANGAVDTALVGASDFRYLGAPTGRDPIGEGAVALVVRRLDDAERAGQRIFAILDAEPRLSDEPSHRAVVGHCGAADALVAVLADVLAQARDEGIDLPEPSPLPERPVRVPHSGPPLPDLRRAWTAPFGGATVPLPVPRRADEPPVTVAFTGPAHPATVPLTWGRWIGLPAEPPAFVAPKPAERPAVRPPERVAPERPIPTRTPPRPVPRPFAGIDLSAELAAASDLARAASRAAVAVAEVHEAFLAEQQRATARILSLGASLERALDALRDGQGRPPAPVASRPAPEPTRRAATLAVDAARPVPPPRAPIAVPPPRAPIAAPPPRAPIAAPPAAPRAPDASVPRSFDRAALERFAAGSLSSVLGPSYADLDGYDPRVRLPKGGLLLVSRVVDVEGTRGVLGPSRIVTEYDLDPASDWAWEGKPPPCVVVESGQADLFLCAVLGTDEICRGERLYRLLDCDLTFHRDRPLCGETLRHDIRIDRFARLGATLLFYFHYDCTTADGRPVLTMRNGCAGFFTSEELAIPQGVDPAPRAVPAQTALGALLPDAPNRLDETALRALAEARYADAFGPAFAPADGSSLRLPPSRWGLLSRVSDLTVTGAPHGLGRVVAEQDLADDDWFNAIHFQGDPCMPGTLMFDGCVQALEVWLMAQGVPAAFPKGSFEPLPGVAARLRCRGQVVPGHKKLTYEVQVREAALEPFPYAIADVVLSVDGVPVVRAEDVSICVRGARVPLRRDRAIVVPEASLLEFAIGDPSRAFGPSMAPYDGDVRTPRIPGPPLATMHGITAVDGAMGHLEADHSATAVYAPDPSSWTFVVDGTGAMPLGVLLETALQPCGWLTAWQGSALALGGDVYFRNLGGTLTWHRPVRPETGPIHTTATLKSVSRSAGMLLTGFTYEMRAGDALVARGDTTFGYFTADALAAQKGLSLPPDDLKFRRRWRSASGAETPELYGHPWMPRDDWRFLDRITVASPRQGSKGKGYWEAEAAVDPKAWFFTAHFHQDPVMPGSLGLEGLLQLARYVLLETLGGSDRPVIPLLEATTTWKYRGQVTQKRRNLTFGLDVTFIDREQGLLRGNGILWVDGLPIYALDDFGVQLAPPVPAPVPVPVPGRPAALLDQVTLSGDTLTGTLRLDPAQHPWLRDHCPTLVIPAVPLAFAAEIAAEAATLLRTGKRIVGIPEITAEKWLHTADGPVDLIVVAIAEGDAVAVTLAVHHENARFPHLSGPKVHMRAIVRTGQTWAPAPAAPAPLVGSPVALSVREYYDSGYTFHGPVLQGMTDLGTRGADGATARFATRPDADLLPPGSPAFVLDPLILDTATHPMMSGVPETWVPGLAHGKLAYPATCRDLLFHGPRPEGPVACRLVRVEADARHLVFDVTLSSEAGPWATFRWTETLVDGGPLLGADPEAIRVFSKERRPADVHVGRATEHGWSVHPDDLVEPLQGTLLRLTCTPSEVALGKADDEPARWLARHLAAKEAVRAHLVATLGRDVHPSRLRLAVLRPDRLVVTDAFDLKSDEQVAHLHPTRVVVHVAEEAGAFIARIGPP